MSITDELREYAKDSDGVMYGAYQAILTIADRIDAKHEGELLETGENILRDVRRKWVRLPLDVDEVPWSVGDHDEDGNEVIALKLASDGWYVITDGEWPYRPERKRHYHTSTVEDVLTEFGIDWECAEDGEDRAAVLKEYATKFRLAEEDA